MKRWLGFIFISLPLQQLVTLVYPFAILGYLLIVRPRFKRLTVKQVEFPPKMKSLDWLMEMPNKTRDSWFFDTDDTHNLLNHCHLYLCPQYRTFAPWALGKTESLTGSLFRRFPGFEGLMPVSVDCHAGWMFVATNPGYWDPVIDEVADHFIKNCFGLKDPFWGFVSARSSCSGVNLVGDAKGSYGLGWPCVGVYFFTAMAQLALVSKNSQGIYKLFYEMLYHAFFWAMGGPLQFLASNLHTSDDERYYLQHVTMMNLYVIAKSRPRSPWWRLGMWWIRKVTHVHGNINPWFEALAYDAGLEVDRARAICNLVAFDSSDIFQWQRSPMRANYFVTGTGENFPASKQSIAYLLKAWP